MRIATYNIQYGRGKDGRFDIARVVEAVESADIIALQEVVTILATHRHGRPTGRDRGPVAPALLGVRAFLRHACRYRRGDRTAGQSSPAVRTHVAVPETHSVVTCASLSKNCHVQPFQHGHRSVGRHRGNQGGAGPVFFAAPERVGCARAPTAGRITPRHQRTCAPRRPPPGPALRSLAAIPTGRQIRHQPRLHPMQC